MKIIKTELEGALIIEPRVFEDTRGYFMETYQQERYKDAGIDKVLVQDNLSYSVKNTLRGLHYQINKPQAKLVQVLKGKVFDVAVDIRKDSSTYGKWVGVELSDVNNRQFYIPEGFAHGFCVLSETAYFVYKCSDYYSPEDEGGILWSDPDIGIKWPVSEPVLSEKDMKYSCLKEIKPEMLPVL
jgi:dTDP-4-dehydrorhamnose 3,5-epimerase